VIFRSCFGYNAQNNPDFQPKFCFCFDLTQADDSYSGTQWERPGWQELLAMVERDEVGAILVKTMDRMGRDYLRMGLYREMFAEKGIRLIALSEGWDSTQSDEICQPPILTS
jgi:DNA invertase Pin-like site-specific DNA recombinase